MMMAITHEEERERTIGQQFVVIGSSMSGPLRRGSRGDESARTGFDRPDMKAGLSPLPKPFLMLSLQALVLMGKRTCLLCMPIPL